MDVRQISIVLTGGTIEKIYDEVRGGIDNIEGWLDRIFPRIRLPYVKIHPTRLMNIDSIYMTDDHRALICQTIKLLQENQRPIIITHGTDTMVETGKYLQAHLPEIKVPIILTGAMLPLVIQESDGLQNLTESLFATHFLSPGVHIVFHNEVYDIDHVRKNREKKTFEWVD